MTVGISNWLDTLSLSLHPWIMVAARLPWLALLGELGIALLAAMLVHRSGTPMLLRLSARLPFSRRLVQYGHRTGALVLSLYLMQLVLDSAPDQLAGVSTARHLNAPFLCAALTWLGVRCVQAVADTIVEMHPAEAGTNVEARRIQTQSRVLSHSLSALIILLGLGVAFSSMPLLRHIGATLLASAGVAGLIVGLAAKPVLGNLLAGMQLALTQPINLGDVVIVENEWGWIDEITGTYVVVRVWDERRLIVPLQWFIEHPFQNWTRNQTAMLGTVTLWVDYRMPLDALRREARRLCAEAPEWDQRVCATHLLEAGERSMQIRVLVSAGDAGLCWELRAKVRAGLVELMQREYPQFLPRIRIDLSEPAGPTQ